jgi:hypothetical protein
LARPDGIASCYDGGGVGQDRENSPASWNHCSCCRRRRETPPHTLAEKKGTIYGHTEYIYVKELEERYKLLVKNAIDRSQRDTERRTALDLARELGDQEIVALFEEGETWYIPLRSVEPFTPEELKYSVPQTTLDPLKTAVRRFNPGRKFFTVKGRLFSLILVPEWFFWSHNIHLPASLLIY